MMFSIAYARVQKSQEDWIDWGKTHDISIPFIGEINLKNSLFCFKINCKSDPIFQGFM